MKEYNEINNTFIKTSGGGTNNYNDLENKPAINNVPLIGDKTLSQLGINLNEYYTKNETYTKEEVNNLIPSTEENIFLIIKDTTTYEEILSAFNDNKGLLFRNSVIVDGTSYPVIYALKQTNYVLLYVHNHPQIIDVWQVNNDNTYEKTREFVLAENQAIKDYVDNKVGVHMEVGVEKPYGTYTEDGVTYQVYSKIIKIDALPAQAGIEGYPHGITGIKQILQVYGFTTDGFVLNAPRQNIEDNISIYQVQKAGNIQISVGKDRSSKSAYVCLVYAKNN